MNDLHNKQRGQKLRTSLNRKKISRFNDNMGISNW